MNDTLKKFGYPEGLLSESEHWVILLRPQQVTLGSLVLGSKSDQQALSELSADAFLDLHTQVGKIEKALKQAFSYEKINYLMLMMVDPHVHYHVIPRYSTPQQLDTVSYQDMGWPGPPRLDQVNELGSNGFQSLLAHLKPYFSS